MSPVGIIEIIMMIMLFHHGILWTILKARVDIVNIQMNGKTKILRFFTHSGQWRACIPLAIRNGANKVYHFFTPFNPRGSWRWSDILLRRQVGLIVKVTGYDMVSFQPPQCRLFPVTGFHRPGASRMEAAARRGLDWWRNLTSQRNTFPFPVRVRERNCR